MFWTIKPAYMVSETTEKFISALPLREAIGQRGEARKTGACMWAAWKKDADRITTVLNRLLNSCSRWKLNGKVWIHSSPVPNRLQSGSRMSGGGGWMGKEGEVKPGEIRTWENLDNRCSFQKVHTKYLLQHGCYSWKSSGKYLGGKDCGATPTSLHTGGVRKHACCWALGLKQSGSTGMQKKWLFNRVRALKSWEMLQIHVQTGCLRRSSVRGLHTV